MSRQGGGLCQASPSRQVRGMHASCSMGLAGASRLPVKTVVSIHHGSLPTNSWIVSFCFFVKSVISSPPLEDTDLPVIIVGVVHLDLSACWVSSIGRVWEATRIIHIVVLGDGGQVTDERHDVSLYRRGGCVPCDKCSAYVRRFQAVAWKNKGMV